MSGAPCGREFEGQVIVVTGAGKGIGRGIALGFAREGARVVVNARTAPSLEAVAGEILAAGGEAFAVRADVSDAVEVERLVATTVERYGRLDVLVNNAGVYMTSPVVEMSEADWDLTLDVDLKGVFLCSRAAARQMVGQRSGRIINITSIAQVRGGTPGHAHYGAAKAGVGAFSKTLAKELGPFGITVNCVAPALVDTSLFHGLKEEIQERLIKTVPLARIGTPADIAQAVLSFACDEASYVTGQVLYVCGGRSLASPAM